MKIFKDIYLLKKVSKTNGVAWCLFEDKFGVSRCALLAGEWSEITTPTRCNGVVVTANENGKNNNTLVVLNMN